MYVFVQRNKLIIFENFILNFGSIDKKLNEKYCLGHFYLYFRQKVHLKVMILVLD